MLFNLAVDFGGIVCRDAQCLQSQQSLPPVATDMYGCLECQQMYAVIGVDLQRAFDADGFKFSFGTGTMVELRVIMSLRSMQNTYMYM